jgi:hypothetical protein
MSLVSGPVTSDSKRPYSKRIGRSQPSDLPPNLLVDDACQKLDFSPALPAKSSTAKGKNYKSDKITKNSLHDEEQDQIVSSIVGDRNLDSESIQQDAEAQRKSGRKSKPPTRLFFESLSEFKPMDDITFSHAESGTGEEITEENRRTRNDSAIENNQKEVRSVLPYSKSRAARKPGNDKDMTAKERAAEHMNKADAHVVDGVFSFEVNNSEENGKQFEIDASEKENCDHPKEKENSNEMKQIADEITSSNMQSPNKMVPQFIDDLETNESLNRVSDQKASRQSAGKIGKSKDCDLARADGVEDDQELEAANASETKKSERSTDKRNKGAKAGASAQTEGDENNNNKLFEARQQHTNDSDVSLASASTGANDHHVLAPQPSSEEILGNSSSGDASTLAREQNKAACETGKSNGKRKSSIIGESASTIARSEKDDGDIDDVHAVRRLQKDCITISKPRKLRRSAGRASEDSVPENHPTSEPELKETEIDHTKDGDHDKVNASKTNGRRASRSKTSIEPEGTENVQQEILNKDCRSQNSALGAVMLEDEVVDCDPKKSRRASRKFGAGLEGKGVILGIPKLNPVFMKQSKDADFFDVDIDLDKTKNKVKKKVNPKDLLHSDQKIGAENICSASTRPYSKTALKQRLIDEPAGKDPCEKISGNPDIRNPYDTEYTTKKAHQETEILTSEVKHAKDTSNNDSDSRQNKAKIEKGEMSLTFLHKETRDSKAIPFVSQQREQNLGNSNTKGICRDQSKDIEDFGKQLKIQNCSSVLKQKHDESNYDDSGFFHEDLKVESDVKTRNGSRSPSLSLSRNSGSLVGKVASKVRSPAGSELSYCISKSNTAETQINGTKKRLNQSVKSSPENIVTNEFLCFPRIEKCNSAQDKKRGKTVDQRTTQSDGSENESRTSIFEYIKNQQRLYSSEKGGTDTDANSDPQTNNSTSSTVFRGENSKRTWEKAFSFEKSQKLKSQLTMDWNDQTKADSYSLLDKEDMDSMSIYESNASLSGCFASPLIPTRLHFMPTNDFAHQSNYLSSKFMPKEKVSLFAFGNSQFVSQSLSFRSHGLDSEDEDFSLHQAIDDDAFQVQL